MVGPSPSLGLTIDSCIRGYPPGNVANKAFPNSFQRSNQSKGRQNVEPLVQGGQRGASSPPVV